MLVTSVDRAGLNGVNGFGAFANGRARNSIQWGFKLDIRKIQVLD